uniref:Ovule protein n=1 Tax=Panagrellus redivivus TaxID=6233 RepID=A0A7E4W4N2_PANRE
MDIWVLSCTNLILDKQLVPCSVVKGEHFLSSRAGPVEMNFNEHVQIYWAKKPVKSISEQWKSYGFEEDDSDSKFIIKKEYENVKLVHRIEHED